VPFTAREKVAVLEEIKHRDGHSRKHALSAARSRHIGSVV
jgi:hypothetical protein